VDKWADYGISKVEYNKEWTHINRVLVHEDKGDSIGYGIEWARSKVVSLIESGKTFVTITKNNEANWNRGEDVRIITVKSTKYIRTDKNSTEADNLGKLPEF
jgi:hypothetical protein